LPVCLGSLIHYTVITSPIVSGKDSCKICQCLTAGLIQSLSSTLYPLIFSSISCIYFSNYFVTYPIPESFTEKSSRKYLYEIVFKAIKKNKKGFISIAIFNFLLLNLICSYYDSSSPNNSPPSPPSSSLF